MDAGSKGVRGALETLCETLRTFEIDEEATGTVGLVVAEVLNNIVEHAYGALATIAPVDITGRLTANGLCLRITDRGRPMPGGKLPPGCIPALDVEVPNLPEGGFGWFLIRDLARDLVYQRVGEENRLSLCITLGSPSARQKIRG
ncbi:ATP-binding protein [Marimonas sp. MJW-29]|uniref:ATP-binding protein n=1 Tax=Sulfitobacter sediminis TaxID=3234186 RepID=A0ABV3RLS4_9RHOB